MMENLYGEEGALVTFLWAVRCGTQKNHLGAVSNQRYILSKSTYISLPVCIYIEAARTHINRFPKLVNGRAARGGRKKSHSRLEGWHSAAQCSEGVLCPRLCTDHKT